MCFKIHSSIDHNDAAEALKAPAALGLATPQGYRMGMGRQDGDGDTGLGWGGRTGMGRQDRDEDTGLGWGGRTGMGKKNRDVEAGWVWGGRTRKGLLRPSSGAALYCRPQGRGLLLLGVGAKVPLALKPTFHYLEDAGFVTTTETQSHQQSALCEQRFLSMWRETVLHPNQGKMHS